MAVSILPYGQPSRHYMGMSRVPLSSVIGKSNGESMSDGACLADLGPDDHLIMYASSRAFTANFRDVQCRVSISLVEPPSIQARYYRWLRWTGRRYHRVFTYCEQLTGRLSNARHCEHGGRTLSLPTASVDGKSSDGKSKLVSLLASAKRTTQGHRLRHRVGGWAKANQVPLDLWGSGFGAYCSLEDALEAYMFSVVIENCAYPGYFTEKLIDCISAKTIPIYWGDPKISKVFDPRGIISCSTANQLQQAIASCRPELYLKMLPFLEENMRRARRFETMPVVRAAEQLMIEDAA